MSAGLLAVMLLLLAVVAALFWPLRAGRASRRGGAQPTTALEIARDAKLGELHDLELDFRLGKLSPEDYRTLNETLRSEAVEAIRLLDATTTNGRRSRR
ncbi:MAG TPA: hypothetical protein VFH80_23495 [Solirubrobacteraceae bacterium]|nr:hypothetical protein [Solirubrobacteraceae bacterium]